MTRSSIFICFRREDTSAHAARLYDKLAARFGADRIFLDVDMQPGFHRAADFLRNIEEAVASSDALLVLIGPDWLTASGPDGRHRLDDPQDLVRLEIAAALEANRPVIPLLVEGARMPRPEELPEPLRPLSRQNALELSAERFSSDVARIMQAVEEALGEQGLGPGAPMQPSRETRVAVVGQDNLENLRLAHILRELIGRENVFRHLETDHLLTFLEEHVETPIVVFVDIFSFELLHATQVVGQIRDRYPRVVFSLYMDPDEWKTRRVELPGDWSDRFDHYYHLYKVPNDEEFEPIVRHAFRDVSWEAQYNFGHNPIRITEPFDSGILPPDPSSGAEPLGEETVFVSYSRRDWDDAVSAITQRLRQAGFQLWVDQGFLVGGEDWMDAIGEALKKCSVCLLAMSPDAMRSRYVKMEYRFFFNNDKPIVPVKVKPVAELPPELSGIQYIDFTIEKASNYDELHRTLARSAGT